MIYRAGLEDIEHVNACIARDFEGVDFSEVIADPLNVVLVEADGGAAFMYRGPGIYEVHVFFRVGGRDVLDVSHRMLDRMRADFGAWLFWAPVPDGSRKVKIFTRWMGWKSRGPLNTRHGPMEIFVSEECGCHQQ